MVANLESEIRKLCEVGGRRSRVALLPTQTPASREPGLPLNPPLGRIPAKMRAELTSAEIAMSGSYFDHVLRDPRRYGIENTTDKVRRPGAVRRRRDAVHRAHCRASGSNPHERAVGVPPTDRRLGARISVGRFGQVDLYPSSGWRVVQDIAASASSIPSQRTELRRLFRETIPDCTLQCGPTKRGLSTCLAKRRSLCVS
ncbi:MAG TPA: hypothetical protein VLI45_00585, partial [Acidobacteriaceae bacterium]|nr:hypothetical protein [Acidobacteriaceae bacterium]